MERQHERDLEILTAIDEGEPLTQRALAQRLGVALGLANLYLKRLAKKGSIKIVEFPKKPAARKRLRYSAHADRHGREDAAHLRAHGVLAQPLPARAADAAREPEPAPRARGQAHRAVRHRRGGGGGLPHASRAGARAHRRLRARGRAAHFLGFPGARARRASTEDHDAVIVATFDRPEPALAELGRRRARRAIASSPCASRSAAAAPGAEEQHAVRPAGDIRRFPGSCRAYLGPYWPAVALLVVLSYRVRGAGRASPRADGADPRPGAGDARAAAPARRRSALGGLSLKNLGAAVFQWLGVRSVGRALARDRVCSASSTWPSASLQELGGLRVLPPRPVDPGAGDRRDADGRVPPPARACPCASSRGSSTGELVSRLDTDTRAAAAGLEPIVGTVLTAPVLIAFYAWLLVRTSPRLVLAAVAAVGAALRRHARPPRADPPARHRPVHDLRRAARALPGDHREHPRGEVLRRRALRDGPARAAPSTRCAAST